MVGSIEKAVWVVAFGVLIVFAIPWFLWRNDAVVAGLPVWVWWHVAWLGAASITFWAFGRRAWGIGVTGGPDSGGESA